LFDSDVIASISFVSQVYGWKKTVLHTCWIISKYILLPAPFGQIKIWIVQSFSTVKLVHDALCKSWIYGNVARLDIITFDNFILKV
jgi:hypothetical protein